MSNYGQVAVLAVQLFRRGQFESPRDAWEQAARQLLSKASLREKNCPRATFLSLSQAGLVTGIPAGTYTRARENAEYAVEAIRRIAADNSLLKMSPRQFWSSITGRNGPKYNEQVEVIFGLWINGLIVQDQIAQVV